jgi:hypothetical protein
MGGVRGGGTNPSECMLPSPSHPGATHYVLPLLTSQGCRSGGVGTPLGLSSQISIVPMSREILLQRRNFKLTAPKDFELFNTKTFFRDKFNDEKQFILDTFCYLISVNVMIREELQNKTKIP